MGALLLLVIIGMVVAVRYGAFGERPRNILAAGFRTAFLLGGIGFAGGFVGPIIFAPGANQGPMLGIFITGPLGFVIGLAYGAIREWVRPGSTSVR